MKTVHIRDNHYELLDEIVTFGPRMGHDDTIESLAYATMNAYPPQYKYDDNSNTYSKHKPSVKSWVVA